MHPETDLVIQIFNPYIKNRNLPFLFHAFFVEVMERIW